MQYRNNQNVGTASVILTGKGKYNGTVKAGFAIHPKGTSIKKLTAGKTSFTAKWQKQTAQTSGYQLQYSTGKSFKSGAVTKTIGRNTTVSQKVKKLKKGKRYYVRIRTWKKTGGKTYVSNWSKAKSTVVK